MARCWVPKCIVMGHFWADTPWGGNAEYLSRQDEPANQLYLVELVGVIPMKIVWIGPRDWTQLLAHHDWQDNQPITFYHSWSDNLSLQMPPVWFTWEACVHLIWKYLNFRQLDICWNTTLGNELDTFMW